MRILEVCPFSSGICGVWSRVKQESIELSKKGHEVYIFSSNIEKGTNKIVPSYEEIQGIKIRRFKGKKSSISKNVIYWFHKAWKDLEEYNPDIIITHLLHPHSAILCKKIKLLKKQNPKIEIFIVPHAPFKVGRQFLLNLATKWWRRKSLLDLNKFDKVILIADWEKKYYLFNENKKLKVPEAKLDYVPNGIPNEFFTQKKSPEKNKVLFLGRIAPIKNLEILISVARQFPKIDFSIVGVAESKYFKKINLLKPKNVQIYFPIYDTKKKINLIDEHKIFILPSKREAMPQSLIEAMARGKIVISSDTDGGKEIIKDSENGFLFEIGNKQDLKNKIVSVLEMKPSKISKIQKNAINSVKKYGWGNLINSYTSLFKK
jgi:glycosyltransferase involved in cell wall biosynthesis